MTDVIGVILAGGRGKRLGGVIKADIAIGGTRLLDRAVSVLGSQCATVVVSAGRLPATTMKTHLNLPVIADLGEGDAGPVAGLAAAVDWAHAHNPSVEFILTAAVDTPFFPDDFVQRAVPMLTQNVDCVMGIEGTLPEGTQPYPTNTLWRVSALKQLPYLAETGQLPHGFRKVITSDKTAYLDYPAYDPNGCFFNINTPEDLTRAKSMIIVG